MGAERCGATGAEVAESLELAIRQGVAPALEKLLFVLTRKTSATVGRGSLTAVECFL